MDIIYKKLKRSMGGNLAAELEDWSFAPSNHPGVAKSATESTESGFR